MEPLRDLCKNSNIQTFRDTFLVSTWKSVCFYFYFCKGPFRGFVLQAYKHEIYYMHYDKYKNVYILYYYSINKSHYRTPAGNRCEEKEDQIARSTNLEIRNSRTLASNIKMFY